MDTPQVIAAWIAATVSMLTLSLQAVFRYLDGRSKRKQTVLEKRQEALLAALEAVDHVYANLTFNNVPPTNPHDWDITLARHAMNKMILYCKDPRRAVDAFAKAVGLHNPDTEAPPQIRAEYLEEFRNVVSTELGLSETKYVNPDIIWISKLAGSR